MNSPYRYTWVSTPQPSKRLDPLCSLLFAYILTLSLPLALSPSNYLYT